MVATPTRRRPRVRFETVLPAPPSELPRMDVAAFVGFAAAGPLDTPVRVEDAASFRDIFGGPLPIAWEPERSAMVESYLAGAVEAFFENGGRRAWVVRVAGRSRQHRQSRGDSTEARSAAAPPILHRFELPGLVDGERLARVVARSEGSWCESMAAGAFEIADPMAVESVFDDAGTAVGRGYAGWGLALSPGSLVPIPGDLCRAVFADDGLTLFVEVERVVVVEGRRFVLARGTPDCFAHRPHLPLASVTSVTKGDAAPWPLPDALVETGPALALEYAPGALPDVERGDLLRLELADGREARLTVTSIDPGLAGSAWSGNVPARVESSAAFWSLAPAEAFARIRSAPAAARVELGLAVFDGEAVASTVRGLGFAPRHPRFLGDLPTDRALFRSQASSRHPPVAPSLRSLVVEPRFPLAGAGPPTSRLLPIGLPSGPLRDFARTVLTPGRPEDRLVRDGLDVFGAELFVDDRLTGYGAATLMGTAEHLLDIAEADLEGLHALVPVREVSMIALPDAAHRSWSRAEVAPIQLLGAPTLDPDPGSPSKLAWTLVTGATRYRLEVSENSAFEPAERWYEGTERSVDVMPEEVCSRRRYYRVRGETAADAGPWSNTVALRLPEVDFSPCSEGQVVATTITEVGSPSGMAPHLDWTPAAPIQGATWELEESEEPGFLGPTTIYSGPETSSEAPVGADGARYFRVRSRLGGAPGPWSNTVTVITDSRAPSFVLEPTDEGGGGSTIPSPPAARDQARTEDERLAIQRAALRFAAARSDTVVFLSSPRHLRPEDVAASTRRLVLPGGPTGARVSVPALTESEASVLAHGAMIAPWLVLADLQPVPADGVVVGSVARLTIARGAWVAPANRPLAGVLGTSPRASPAENDRAIDAGVDVVEADPRGFVLRTAYTLSSDPALLDLSVARLVHLVRRWLRRLGQTYVFETNGHALAARVQDDIERALVALWSRGALAGARPAEAFEVVTGRRNDDRRSRDAGRFVVEVRIAPSRPLTFLLVRLVETDLGSLAPEVS